MLHPENSAVLVQDLLLCLFVHLHCHCSLIWLAPANLCQLQTLVTLATKYVTHDNNVNVIQLVSAVPVTLSP